MFGNALIEAAYSGDVDLVEKLLESKADPNQKNLLGYTPLGICIRRRSDHGKNIIRT